MGFLDSFLAWIIMIFIVALILFGVFAYMLGWFYPSTQSERRELELEQEDETSIEERKRQSALRRRVIYIFAFVMIIIIAASGGINAMTTTTG